MKILCVADVIVPDLYDRSAVQRFGPVDLVISCGDLPPEYLSFLLSAFDVPVLYVQGNHDIRYHQSPPLGCLDIHGRIVHHGPMKILGLAGSRWYNGGANQYTEVQMQHLLRRLRPKMWWRRGVDMVVAHAPPRFVNDAEDLCHRGFKTYRQLIQRYAPLYFLHGHIHATFSDASQRITRLGDTRVINCFGHYLMEIDEDQMARKTE
jgi:uncharacterized protein